MITVKVNATTCYNVNIGRGLLKEAGLLIGNLTRTKTVVTVTDDIVEKIYLKTLNDSLINENYNVKVFVMQNGEANKSLENYGRLLQFMAEEGVARADTVIAFGGGVVGDLAAFAASTYMRGISFINFPTTLLSGIDSSVGGKTAVDLPQGKNLVGTFYQPKGVFFDLDVLDTLTEADYKNGIGELIKTGVLSGGELWGILEGGEENLKQNIERAVTLAIEYKRDIVEADEFEGGKRRLLNLGHTLAHGIEALSSYTVPHGEAVAIGLKMIAEADAEQGKLDKNEYERILNVLNAFKINTSCEFDIGRLAEAARVDKKVEEDKINIVTVKSIGKCAVEKLPLSELEGFFNGSKAKKI